MLKRIFTKKTSKTDSKKTSTNKKKGAKKKKIIKSTEKAVKKKMAPTKKTEYVQDSESGISTDAINSIGASSILEEASDSGESSANGDGISTDQYDEGSKENS